MKRHNNLFEKVCDRDNLILAFKHAKKNKGWQRKVKKIANNLDYYIDTLQAKLINGTYKTSKYRTKTIYEPKERLIYILPFYPDRIVHHAIMNILEPIWDNLMYYHSYACRKKKGMHKGSTLCMEYVRQYRYVLKCDVSKFYPSVNHAILKELLRHKIKDTKLLEMLDEIIDSAEGETNVPIGNYLSQWYGNMFLNELDTYVKYTLMVKPYIRYCDDFVLFSNSKEELHKWLELIRTFLLDRRLKLSKDYIFPTSHGVDFLGYRHFPDKILLRKRTAKSTKKNIGEIMHLLRKGMITKEQALSKIASAKGLLKHAQCYNLGQALDIDAIREEVLAFEEIQ